MTEKISRLPLAIRDQLHLDRQLLGIREPSAVAPELEPDPAALI